MATGSNKMKKLLLILAIPLFCHAELIVIDDVGGESTYPYFESINPQDEISQQHYDSIQPPAELNTNFYFPISSSKMQPGNFKRRAMNIVGLQPFFIIGFDEYSINWLNQRKKYLSQMNNVVGLVVNVENEKQLEQLKQIIPNILLTALPGDDIADRLGVYTYPVLVTATGIEQ